MDFSCLYTHQKAKKHKTWHDGILECSLGNGFVHAVLHKCNELNVKIQVLERGQLPNTKSLSSLAGTDFEFPGHLIEIAEPLRNPIGERTDEDQNEADSPQVPPRGVSQPESGASSPPPPKPSPRSRKRNLHACARDMASPSNWGRLDDLPQPLPPKSTRRGSGERDERCERSERVRNIVDNSMSASNGRGNPDVTRLTIASQKPVEGSQARHFNPLEPQHPPHSTQPPVQGQLKPKAMSEQTLLDQSIKEGQSVTPRSVNVPSVPLNPSLGGLRQKGDPPRSQAAPNLPPRLAIYSSNTPKKEMSFEDQLRLNIKKSMLQAEHLARVSEWLQPLNHLNSVQGSFV
eukprot:GHVN01075998.1.p1 GENE.GHVN01075998.1~~GHVN01075998.1.p1  ORF type:complete len:346 (-),score=45.69 GHVN01075998.1:301-1338(-)